MICKACQKIFRGDLQLFEGEEPGSYISDRRVHHMTIKDLYKAIGELCLICAWIWCHVADDGKDRTLEACSSFTQYGFHERNGVRTLAFFRSDSYILRVVLVPLKGLLYP